MSGTTVHEAYTAYRAFIFAFTALAVFFNTFLNCILVESRAIRYTICGGCFVFYVFSISIRELLPL